VPRFGRRAGRLSRNRDYLHLWGAQGISAFGSQITLVALPLVAILTLEASTFEVAALTALELLPFLLLGIPAGVWVDRLPRRPVLVLCDIGRAASLFSVPLAYWLLGEVTLPHLYAVALVTGALTVFFTLAYQAYLPVLVEREDLVAANARFEATETLARLAGPASGGGLVAVLSAPAAILADAVSFVVSGALILRIGHRERGGSASTAAATPRGFRHELREGARFVVRDRLVRSILATTALVNVGFGMVWAILLVYAVRDLGLGAALVGVTLSVGEVGGLLGAVAVGRLTSSVGPGRVVIGTALLFAPAFLLLALAPSGMPLPFLALGWAVVSFASVAFNATTVGIRQARVPLRLQGRVVGVSRSVVWGVTPIGALLGGGLAAVVGMRATIAAGAAVALGAAIPALLSPLRDLRSLPESSEPEQFS